MLIYYIVNNHTSRTPDENLSLLLDDLSIAEDAGNEADDELSGEQEDGNQGEEKTKKKSHHQKNTLTHSNFRDQTLSNGRQPE